MLATTPQGLQEYQTQDKMDLENSGKKIILRNPDSIEPIYDDSANKQFSIAFKNLNYSINV